MCFFPPKRRWNSVHFNRLQRARQQWETPTVPKLFRGAVCGKVQRTGSDEAAVLHVGQHGGRHCLRQCPDAAAPGRGRCTESECSKCFIWSFSYLNLASASAVALLCNCVAVVMCNASCARARVCFCVYFSGCTRSPREIAQLVDFWFSVFLLWAYGAFYDIFIVIC